MPAGWPTLPAGPLVERVRARGGFRVCAGRDDRLERAYSRAQAVGRLTVWAADQLAVKVLGLPPLLVWGDAWLEPDEPAAPVVPARRTNCRPGWGPCRRRHDHSSPRRAGLA